MSTTIRVVHLVATMRDGGAEALLRGLLPLLAGESDLDVHVVSVYDPRLSAQEFAAMKVPVHTVGRRSRLDVSFAPRLVSTLRKLQPDIVHAHIHTGKFVGRMAAIVAGVPNIVFTEHGDEARGVIHWTMSRILNARTKCFVVFTEEERRRYAAAETIPLSRIKVIANGIPEAEASDKAATRKELGLSDECFAIALPARLAPQKNQQLAIRAIATLRAQGRTKIRLLIIGDGPDADALRGLVNDLNLIEWVTFLGYRVDAPRLIAACDALCLSSRWEKMPLVIGEAMLAGITVVSTPWTGATAFIEDSHTGYIASDWSIEAFAAALARPIDDPAESKDIAVRARVTALELFDVKQMVRRHAELYRTLTARSIA